MSNFNILVCEDNPTDQRNIKLHLNQVMRDLPEAKITYTLVNFEDTYDQLNGDYKLLILDLFDKESNSNAGDNILMHNGGNKKIPTVIYTNAGDSLGFDINVKKNQYPFLIDKLTKFHDSGENLINLVKGTIIVGAENKYYKLYNSSDEMLSLAIKLVGRANFNYILYQIRETFGNKEILVYPMTSGLSGAILFKLEIGNLSYILKLSKEISSLKAEHEKGMDLFRQFPTHLINPIDQGNQYYSFDKNVLGIMIKNVERSETFFDFLAAGVELKKEEIENLLHNLYLDANALSSFFRSKRGEDVDWTAIFQKIDEGKIFLVKKSFKELTPIILKYYGEIDMEDFRRLAISHDYNNLNKKKLLEKEYFSGTILSHGDFHSKNILVQAGRRPVIIDTGAIGYQHWSLDYSRLIVHLFITGFNNESVEYFNLAEIPTNIGIVDNILNEEEIDCNGVNANFIVAINWLIANYRNIYGSVNRFELLLGLMKEFLQASYRFDTIPPNKRAIAIIAAHKCMLKADEIVKNVNK